MINYELILEDLIENGELNYIHYDKKKNIFELELYVNDYDYIIRNVKINDIEAFRNDNYFNNENNVKKILKSVRSNQIGLLY